ncbi:MAG: 2-oxo acid dehydrogenase subunit E2 [Armatimonadetes bacterium]|nr:2-oxo acid dehydrogenase subunit E2 [Armatimonadota bacterium]
MATVFHLPLLGQTMQEGTILRWLKQEGEPVEGWEPIVEVMTDKVNMEVEPQTGGTLRKILVPEGAVIPVGAPVAILGAPDEDISRVLAELAGPAGATAAPAAGGVPVPSPATLETPAAVAPNGSGNGGAAPTAPAEVPAVSPRARETAAAAGLDWRALQIAGSGYEGMIVERDVQAFLAQQEARRVRLTPLAAKLAAEQGVCPETLSPSGPGGRVRAEDVRRAAVPVAAAQEIALTGVRKVIAERLAASYRTAVHVPLRVDVDMEHAASLRAQLQQEWERRGLRRLTYTDLIAAAAARALREFPTLNGTLEGDTLRLSPAIHLGLAVALDDGLVVPVVRNADRLTLPDLSAALADLAARARSGQLPPDAFAGGTFTLTNLGQFGVDSFDPILNPPQITILGAGRIAPRLVAYQGQPAVRQTITLTLTFDHRAVDGAPAAQCLARVKELLENPARLLVSS